MGWLRALVVILLAVIAVGCGDNGQSGHVTINGTIVDRFFVSDRNEYKRLYDITLACVSMFKDVYPVYDNSAQTEVVIVDGEISYKGVVHPGWTEHWDTDFPIIYLSDTSQYELIRHEFEHAILRMGVEGHDLDVFKLCAYQGGD